MAVRLDFLAAAIKRSISAVVRYSRVRTEEFTVLGADRPPLRFSTIFCPCSKQLAKYQAFFPQYQRLNATHRQRAATSSRKRHSHAPCGGTRSIGSHIARSVRSVRE